MSFILDALKKSEVERQRQTHPGLMDPGAAPRHRRVPAWAVAFGGLLAVNLAVGLYLLMRGGAPARPAAEPPLARTTPAVAAAGTAAVPTRANPAQTDSAPAGGTRTATISPTPPTERPPAGFSPLDPAPQYAPEIPVPVAPPGAPVAAATAVQPPTRAAATASADTEVLPARSEINLNGQMPELHLDVHVYSTDPAARFVYINMRKYHEGATLPEGPRVHSIRRDGVVLDFHGLRFLLPRQ